MKRFQYNTNQYLLNQMISLHRPKSIRALHYFHLKNDGNNHFTRNGKPVTARDVNKFMEYLLCD